MDGLCWVSVRGDDGRFRSKRSRRPFANVTAGWDLTTGFPRPRRLDNARLHLLEIHCTHEQDEAFINTKSYNLHCKIQHVYCLVRQPISIVRQIISPLSHNIIDNRPPSLSANLQLNLFPALTITMLLQLLVDQLAQIPLLQKPPPPKLLGQIFLLDPAIHVIRIIFVLPPPTPLPQQLRRRVP